MSIMKTHIENNEIEMINKPSQLLISYLISTTVSLLVLFFVLAQPPLTVVQMAASYLALSLIVVSPFAYIEWERSKDSVAALLIASGITGVFFGLTFQFLLKNLIKLFGVF